MSRFGGVRIPSEIMPLVWSDIDVDKGLIHIRSCKTEGYEGKDQRVIPMFPELRRALMDVYDEAAEGSEQVLTKHRVCCGNLRTTMLRIIKRAGLTAWPKPFHNMRSSRQTELAEKYPIHVVCAWLGNNPSVAFGHYLQVRDSDFVAAIAGDAPATVGSVGAGTAGTAVGDAGARDGA